MAYNKVVICGVDSSGLKIMKESEKIEKIVENMHFTKTFIAARSLEAKDENYYAVYNSPAYGKCLLIFTPNEQILQGMKSYLSKDIVIKLFYNRNVG